jgi:acetyl-CoA synthetase
MDSEDLLFVTYSDDGAGAPAGVMHTTAGYLVGAAATHEYVFDVKDESVYWCKADIGSIAGHSYAVYGPLCNGTTTVICEGAPDDDRHRAVVRRHAVSVVYSARDDLAWSPPASGMILISPLAGLRGGKPGCAGRPFPGVETAVYDGRGRGVAQGSAGHLVVRTPYPAMPRGLYGEPERYRRTYWERFPGVCFTRAWARIDADGDYWILAARN